MSIEELLGAIDRASDRQGGGPVALERILEELGREQVPQLEGRLKVLRGGGRITQTAEGWSVTEQGLQWLAEQRPHAA